MDWKTGLDRSVRLGQQLSVACVGAPYPNNDGGNRQSEIAFCNPGERVFLKPEPKNRHDEHAIAVFSARDFQIGYVSSERAVFLGKLERDKHVLTAIFQEATGWGAVIRVGIDEEPDLPPVRERFQVDSGSDPDAGFWPDYIPPDD